MQQLLKKHELKQLVRSGQARYWLFMLTVLCLNSLARAQDFGSEANGKDGVRNEKNTNGFFPADTVWFNQGAANTVFSKEPEKSEAPQVGFYQERKEKTAEDSKLQPASLKANQPPAAKDPKALPPFDTRKASPDQLVSFYGNPEEDAALTPDEKAPVPFKAMMAAMDSGNDKLAYGYARQYIRYMQNMSERVGRTVQFQELAVEREGLRPGNLKDNPYTKLLEDDLANEETKSKLSLAGLDPKAQRLIRQAQIDEQYERQANNGQKSDSSNATVDPKGEVDVMFFFDNGDSSSLSRAQDIEKLSRVFQSNSKIQFTALSINNLSSSDLLQFANKSGLSITMQNGSKLVGAMGIVNAPTLLLITHNTRKVIRVEDESSVADIRGMIKQMSGKGDA